MNYKVTRSNRKTIALSINDDFTLCVKAPLSCPDRVIEDFVKSKSAWIEKNLELMRADSAEAANEGYLTAAEIRALADEALEYIPGRVKYYAAQLGVTYGRITVRNQTTRWGSCSSKGNLNFNCLLMLMPREMADYTIVHELCHRLEMNHSARFYAHLESVLPDYREREKWMKENGGRILRRMKG